MTHPHLAGAARVVAGLDAACAKAAALGGQPAASKLRRTVVEDDPLRFALLYLPHHLKDEHGRVTISEVHEEWITYAHEWGTPAAPGEERDAFVAPREMGKSTWFFLLLPLWAAATGRVKFAAAFADSATQAEGHLATVKRELDTNALLRADYPDLCKPARRRSSVNVSDNRSLLHTASGFVFSARGIDSGTLGMKVGERRPDLLILDDIEPGEANYSAYQVERRLTTVQDVVLPLNVRARVCLVGTVTMPGSIVHQLVEAGRGNAAETWVEDEGFRVHHSLPTVQDEAGEERSVWPEKWPLDYLHRIRHTRSYAKNFLNEPVATDGAYWTPETFRRGSVPRLGVCLLSVDPAVTTARTSDFSGFAVVGREAGEKRRAVVRHGSRTRATGAGLRRKALALLEEFPEVTHVLVETNQGGDLWREVFHDLPVPLVTKHNTAPKEVRAGEALNHYERGRVLHDGELAEAEAEMCGFPRAPHDDIVDAVGNAVNRLLAAPPKKQRAGVESRSYV